jgi:membrane peptidoglycan carboxypeptidase
VAGKTGTSDGSNETWFVGYTPQLCTAVWVGTPNDYQNKRILRNLKLGDTFYWARSSVPPSPRPPGSGSWTAPWPVCRSATSPSPATR